MNTVMVNIHKEGWIQNRLLPKGLERSQVSFLFVLKL